MKRRNPLVFNHNLHPNSKFSAQWRHLPNWKASIMTVLYWADCCFVLFHFYDWRFVEFYVVFLTWNCFQISFLIHIVFSQAVLARLDGPSVLNSSIHPSMYLPVGLHDWFYQIWVFLTQNMSLKFWFWTCHYIDQRINGSNAWNSMPVSRTNDVMPALAVA